MEDQWRATPLSPRAADAPTCSEEANFGICTQCLWGSCVQKLKSLVQMLDIYIVPVVTLGSRCSCRVRGESESRGVVDRPGCA